MPAVFNPASEGSVVALSIGVGVPAAIRVEELNASNLVVTSFGVNRRSNAQMMPSLNGSVFIYSFGDKMGEMEVSGVAFHRLCLQTSNPYSSFQGIVDIATFYEQYGIGSTDTIQPVFISLGVISIRAFLLGVNATSLNPETNLMQFSMQFSVTPKRVGATRAT